MSVFRLLFSRKLPLILLILTACDEYCDQGTTVAMVVDFYDETAQNNLSLNKYTMSGIDARIMDTVMLRQYKRFALVPLSNNSDTSRYVLQIGNAREDTLVVVSRRHASLVSAECGCVMLGTLDTAFLTRPSDTIKGILLLNRSVNVVSYREDTEHDENLRILF